MNILNLSALVSKIRVSTSSNLCKIICIFMHLTTSFGPFL